MKEYMLKQQPIYDFYKTTKAKKKLSIRHVLGYSTCCLILCAMYLKPVQQVKNIQAENQMKIDVSNQPKFDLEMQSFALAATKNLYTYDYVNYSQQLNNSYFTKEGWNNYIEEYKKSNMLQAVTVNKWLVTVVPRSFPIIIKKGIADNIYWEVEIPIKVSYSGNSSLIQQGNLYMKITKNSLTKNHDGLGIEKISFHEENVN